MLDDGGDDDDDESGAEVLGGQLAAPKVGPEEGKGVRAITGPGPRLERARPVGRIPVKSRESRESRPEAAPRSSRQTFDRLP